MKVLIDFRHGLGDAVQLGIVLKHLQRYHPDWVVDVESLVGKHTLFYGLCNQSLVKGSPRTEYDKVFNLRWIEHFSNLPFPPTKVTKSLKDEFNLRPDLSLYSYHIEIQEQSNRAAIDYIKTLPISKGLIVTHFEGNTGSRDKNISEDQIRQIVDFLTYNDFTVIMLDWDRRKASKLANGKTVFCPDANHPLWSGTGTGDGNTLAALISQANLFIGIDSGPLHVAGATKTPALGLWTNHHPANYFDLATNVIHLLPQTQSLKNDHDKLFHKNYRYIYYSDIVDSTLDEIIKLFDLPSYNVCRRNQWMRSDSKMRNVVYI